MARTTEHGGAPNHRVLRFRSTVAAPADQVWRRATSAEGIRHELRPVASMTFPRALRVADLSEDLVGRRLGRAWILLGGVLPVDYDDLTLVALEPGRTFHERSTMLALRHWEHRRTITPVTDTVTEVEDELVLRARVPVTIGVLARLVTALFAHRHRRLVAYWGAA